MTDINRYEIERADEELDNIFGEWVRFEDHAAIVAVKDARIAELEEQVRAMATECKAVYDHALEEGYQFYPGGIEYTNAAIREIRAQAVEGFGATLGNGESNLSFLLKNCTNDYAARIRAGEVL